MSELYTDRTIRPSYSAKIIATVVLIAFFNLFLFHELWPLGVVIIYTALWFFVLSIAPFKNIIRLRKEILILFFFHLLCAISLIKTASIISSHASVIGMTVSLSLLFYKVFLNSSYISSLWELASVPLALVSGYLKGLALWFEHIFAEDTERNASGLGSASSWHTIRSIVMGLIIGLPVALILMGMFSKADPIFAYWWESIISNVNLGRAFWRLVFSFIVFIVITPSIFAKITKVNAPFSYIFHINLYKEATVVILLVVLTTASFLIIQWPYVFVNVPVETDLSKFGITTYSEYVKQGFAQLLRIGVFLYGLSWAGYVVTRTKTFRGKKILAVLLYAMMVELLVFVISVFRRVWLYQSYHGWSLMRIYGGIFLLWLSGMILILLARNIWRKRWVSVEIVTTSLFILVLSFVNFENYLVWSNPPTVNGRIDYVYLARLSSDGYEGWKKSYQHASSVLNNPEYERKGYFDENDRREISYSGYMVLQLTKQYMRLVRYYGSKDEQKLTVNMVLDQKYRLNNDLSETYRYAAQKATPHLEQIKKENLWISSYDNINADPARALGRIMVYYPGYPGGLVYLDKGNLPGSFFSLSLEDSLVRIPDNLDKLYTFNFSWFRSFRRMKTDIPLGSLLLLQDVYIKLSDKISRQPPGETGYRPDISFEAPYLTTVY